MEWTICKEHLRVIRWEERGACPDCGGDRNLVRVISMDEVEGLISQLASVMIERDKLMKAFGFYGPYPLHSVLEHLANAADRLFDRHDYDGHGWEVVDTARKSARKILAALGGLAR